MNRSSEYFCHISSTDSTESDKAKAEDDEAMDDGKVPSFTVLLHGSLKVEGMVALTKVAYVLVL